MFFDTCKTREELKKLWKELCLKHHPDMGGDVETMAQINAEFERMFKVLKDVEHAKTEAGTDQADIPPEFVEILGKLTIIEGVEVEIVGTWIWVSGDTLAHKDQIKEAGCKWSGKRRMWYWHKDEGNRRYRASSEDMDGIRARYGSKSVKGNTRPYIAA